LLAVILLISLVPLSANAATKDTAETAASTERKFQLLLEDLELVENVHRSDRYFYEEIGQYPAKNPEWVLIRGGLIDLSAKNNIQYQYATVGNKLLRANVNSSPFKLGYGIYDIKTGVFYDILDAWDMNLNNLRDVWDNLAPAEKYSEKDKSAENAMYTIGDADGDGKVTILDATRIQRCIAELDENPWEKFAAAGSEFIRGVDIAGATDYDRDGSTTVMDATRIQRGIAELPSILDYKLAWLENILDNPGDSYEDTYLVANLSQLSPDKKDEKMILDAYSDSFLKDHILVGLNISNTGILTLKGVSIDKDGVLNVDFHADKPEVSIDVSFHRFACIELSKAFLDDIKDIKVNISNVPVTIKAKLVANQAGNDRGNNIVAQVLPTHGILKRFWDNYAYNDLSSAMYPTDQMVEDSIALVGVYLKLPTEQYGISLSSADIDKDGVLNLKLTAKQYGQTSGSASPRILLVEFWRAYLDEIRDVKVSLDVNKIYSSSMLWNRKITYTGTDIEDEIITDNSQLDPDNESHAALIRYFEKENRDIPFDSCAYLLAKLPMRGTSLLLSLGPVGVDKDGVLKINLVASGTLSGNTYANSRFVCIELSKSYLEDSKSHRVELIYDDYNINENDEYRPAKHPNLYVEDPMDTNSEVTLITSRSQLDPLLEGHQTLLDDYDDSFFLENNLLAIHYSLPSGADLAQFKDMSVENSYVACVNMLEYKPSLGSMDVKDVTMCIEVPLRYRYHAQKGVKVNHIPAAKDGYIDGPADLESPEIIPEGAQSVDYSEAYSVNLDNAGAYSLTLESYRNNGKTSSSAGVVSIITNPYSLQSFVLDLGMDNGYVENLGFIFEPCRKYQYDLKFFNDYALIGIAHHSDEYLDQLNISGLYQKDEKLYVEAEFVKPEKNSPREADYVTLVKVKRSDIDDCTSIVLGSTASLASVYALIPNNGDQAEMPDDLSAQDYTKLTTTGIAMSAPSPYDLDLSGSPLDAFGAGEDYVALIKTRSEFERFFPGFDTDGAYGEAFFKDNAIIGVLGLSLGCEGVPEIGIAATKGNTLYIEAGLQYPDYGDTLPTAVPLDEPVWTFRSVDKRSVGRVTNITLWRNKNSATATVRAEIPWYNYFEIPTDIAAEDYQSIDAKEINVSSPSWNQFGWSSTPLTASEHGYVLLLRSRREFEKYFPGFDNEKKYDDAYFKENAIIAALVQGDDFTSTAYLNTLAVKNSTLYACAGYSDNYDTDEDGTPIAQPIAPLVHTFRQVKQSDVASITHISLWTPPSPAYNKDLPFTICDDHPVQGNYSETNVADHITSKWAVPSTLRKLYVDEEGNPVERDDYTFNAENYSDASFSSSSLIGMRVFQGSSSANLRVDRVYRSGTDELTVDITRTYETNALNPDMNWRMIFLRINSYKVGGYSRRFTVKLNVQDVESYAPIANTVKYGSASNPLYSHFSSTRRDLKTVKAFSGDYLGPAFTDICGNTTDHNGFLGIVKSVNQFDYLFPGYIPLSDSDREKYNEAYFKDKALVVLVYQCGCDEEAIRLDTVGVVGDTLYGAMTDFTPIATSAVRGAKIDALEVDRSDIENVTRTALWSKPYNEKTYLFHSYDSPDDIPQKPDDFSGYTALKTEEVGTYTVTNYTNRIDWYKGGNPMSAVTYNRLQFEYIAGNIDGLTLTDADFDNYLYFIVICHGSYKGDTAAIDGVYVNNTMKAFAVDTAVNAYQADSGATAPEKDSHTTIAIRRIKKNTVTDYLLTERLDLWRSQSAL
ncbi:MAG: dockerin type I repeat-containing protein, partial [Ruminococcus sp.]|nr:dockerin type I repeat-containing protein [Ruminococcus sp.]